MKLLSLMLIVLPDASEPSRGRYELDFRRVVVIAPTVGHEDYLALGLEMRMQGIVLGADTRISCTLITSR